VSASVLIWAAGLAIGGLFGWAWGYTTGQRVLPREPEGLPHASAEAYQAGWTAAREECLRIARAHDFDTIERRLGAMRPRG
jgi:hypothetical protein